MTERSALTPGPLLAGRTAVVTGGGAGIGRAVVESFIAHGASVLTVEIDEDLATEVPGPVLVADVREADTAAAVVAEARRVLGGIDVLVNNVGHVAGSGAGFTDAPVEEWDAIRQANFDHVLRLTHAVVPVMIEQGRGGSIVNLTTVEAFRGIPHHPVYAAYKAAVSQFSKALAVDLGEHGIRVNDVAPDVTASAQLPYERWLGPDDWEKVPRWVPLGRLGDPIDTAGAVLFLASDLAAFVTGTTIHCDGGTHAAGGWYRTERGPRRWTNRPYDA